MNCGKQGHNKLMMTRIPNFREIIIVAFECIHYMFIVIDNVLIVVLNQMKYKVVQRFKNEVFVLK